MMTPRERIFATLAHEVPDRTPTDGWFHPEVREKLKSHFGLTEWEDVLLALGVEGWKVIELPLIHPSFDAVATERPGGKPGPVAIWHDEQTHEDCWGVVMRKGEGDRYEERIRGPLDGTDDPADLENYPWPVLADQIIADQLAELPQQIQKMKDDQKFVIGGIPNPFRSGWHLRGMNDFLADYAAEPEMIEIMYDNLFAYYGDTLIELTKAGVDQISVIGDIGMQTGMMISPNSWREQDKPRWQKLLDECRSINPSLHCFFHSDGDITEVMDDLVDVGFNIINPIQPECMNPVEVKKRWGDHITLHGGISLQQTLPHGTVDDVRREVSELIETCGYNGGLVAFPSNVLQPDIPVENIVACYQTARDLKLS